MTIWDRHYASFMTWCHVHHTFWMRRVLYMFYVRRRRDPKSLLGLGAADTSMWALWHYVCGMFYCNAYWRLRTARSRWRARWNNPFIFKLIVRPTMWCMFVAKNPWTTWRVRIRLWLWHLPRITGYDGGILTWSRRSSINTGHDRWLSDKSRRWGAEIRDHCTGYDTSGYDTSGYDTSRYDTYTSTRRYLRLRHLHV